MINMGAQNPTTNPPNADKSEQVKRLQDQLHYREGEVLNAETRIRELEDVPAMTDLEENELSELHDRVAQANTAIGTIEEKILQLTSEPDVGTSSTVRGRLPPATLKRARPPPKLNPKSGGQGPPTDR